MELANQEFAELMKNPTSKMSRLLREHIENTVNLPFESQRADKLQRFHELGLTILRNYKANKITLITKNSCGS